MFTHEMISLRAQGIPYAKIAEQAGVSHETVRRRLIKAGVHFAQRSRLTQQEVELVTRLTATGMTAKDIACYMGRSVHAVWEWRRRLGIAPQRIVTPKSIREQAVALVIGGSSYASAAKALGVSKNVVAGAYYRARQKNLVACGKEIE